MDNGWQGGLDIEKEKKMKERKGWEYHSVALYMDQTRVFE